MLGRPIAIDARCTSRSRFARPPLAVSGRVIKREEDGPTCRLTVASPVRGGQPDLAAVRIGAQGEQGIHRDGPGSAGVLPRGQRQMMAG